MTLPRPCEHCSTTFAPKYEKRDRPQVFCSKRCKALDERKRGVPNARPLIERFWAKVEITPSCWVWRGTRNKLGYGYLNSSGKRTPAHRVAYNLLVGPIPEGLELDHLCRNPFCVNPEHLDVVSHLENVRRGMGFSGINFRKTHCSKGHPFDATNTYVWKRNGQRRCLACLYAGRKRRAATRCRTEDLRPS